MGDLLENGVPTSCNECSILAPKFTNSAHIPAVFLGYYDSMESWAGTESVKFVRKVPARELCSKVSARTTENQGEFALVRL